MYLAAGSLAVKYHNSNALYKQYFVIYDQLIIIAVTSPPPPPHQGSRLEYENKPYSHHRNIWPGNNLTRLLPMTLSANLAVSLAVILCGIVLFVRGFFHRLEFFLAVHSFVSYWQDKRAALSCTQGTKYFFLWVLYHRMERTFVKAFYTVVYRDWEYRGAVCIWWA
jgi:hypothetical protein